MSDALTPLRHAYGLDAAAAAAPGAPGYAEQEALRGMAEVLAAAPRRRPAEGALDAVRSYAARASAAHSLAAVRAVYAEGDGEGGAAEVALLGQTRQAVERALGARPQPRPSTAAVDAVLARAAEASGQGGVAVEAPTLVPLASALGFADAPASVERAVLEQSLAALDRAPRPRPSADVFSSVVAFAATASSDGLAAVRYVYEGGAASEHTVEVALLEQGRDIVERAFRARPQPRPTAEVVDAILARAVAATAARADEPTVSEPALAPLALSYGLALAVKAPTGGAETALLAQTQDALDRLRPARPDAAVVANVVARAAAARPARRPASTDRPSAPSSRRWPAGVWAGGAAFMLAALTAIAVLPGVFADGPAPAPPAAAEEEAPGPSLATVGGPTEIEATLDSPARSGGSPAPPPAPAATAPSAAPSGHAAVAERRAAPPRPAATPEPAQETPAWETGQDVRALSLRLDEIDRSIEGLAWDEPAEAFGQPIGTPAATSTPGLRAVREGAAPARARIQAADSSRTPR